MSVALHDIARLVQGRLVGDGEIPITGTATISTARQGDITLADNAKLAPQLARCYAAAAIVPTNWEPAGIPYIAVDDVHGAFAQIVKHFRPPRQQRTGGIHPGASVRPSARIAANVQVQAGASIGDDVEIGEGSIIHGGVQIMDGCRIGAQVVLFPNVVLYENTVLGDHVTLHAGAVLGAYGFGYSHVGGKHRLSAQLGYVEVEADVEIGACTTIDRGTYGPTLIGQGTKIDNHVMIAHNCRIGRHNLICSQVGIAGSSTTGDYVVIAGQVGIRDHVHIGDRAILGAQAGIMNDIPAGQRVLGSPAIDEKEQYRVFAATHKLPDMRKRMNELSRVVEELQDQLATLQHAAPIKRDVA